MSTPGNITVSAKGVAQARRLGRGELLARILQALMSANRPLTATEIFPLVPSKGCKVYQGLNRLHQLGRINRDSSGPVFVWSPRKDESEAPPEPARARAASGMPNVSNVKRALMAGAVITMSLPGDRVVTLAAADARALWYQLKGVFGD